MCNQDDGRHSGTHGSRAELRSVKIEKLINSFANKLAHVAAVKLGDTLTYVQVKAVLDTLPHTLKEM